MPSKKRSPIPQDFGRSSLNLLMARGNGPSRVSRSVPSSPFSETATMASQAQIDANRRNAQRSTGPKTEAGKARAKLNALKDGSHAKTVRPVLPQEDPIELDQRINQWISDLNPRNDAERELVIERGGAGLDHRPDQAVRDRSTGRTRAPGACSRPTNSGTKKSASWAAGSCTTPRQNPCPRPDGPGKTTRPRSWPGWKAAPRDAAGCWITGSALRVLLDRDFGLDLRRHVSPGPAPGQVPRRGDQRPQAQCHLPGLGRGGARLGRAVLEGVQEVQAAARPRLQRLRPLARDRRAAGRRGRGHQVL